eukprot:sb/3474967/
MDRSRGFENKTCSSQREGTPSTVSAAILSMLYHQSIGLTLLIEPVDKSKRHRRRTLDEIWSDASRQAIVAAQTRTSRLEYLNSSRTKANLSPTSWLIRCRFKTGYSGAIPHLILNNAFRWGRQRQTGFKPP